MQRKLLAVLGFLLVYNLAFYQSIFGISFLSLNILFQILLFLLRNKATKQFKLAITFSLFSVLSSLFFSLTSNQILLPLNLALTFFTTSLAFYFYHLGSKFNYYLIQFLIIPARSVISWTEGLFSSPKLLDRTKLSKANSPHTSPLLKGLFLALPIVVIFIFLFNLADPVYHKYTFDILTRFRELFFGPIWERILINAALIVVMLGALSALLKLHHEAEQADLKTEIGKSKQLELISFLTLPVIIFLSFILIQFQYLFSNISERSLSQIGIQSLTYSEYVRKGFFELLIVSLISLSIIGFVSRYLHRVKNKYENILKALITSLIIETQLILFSVVWRVAMYQMEHGLTRNRVIGMFFLIWLSLTIFFYLVKVLTPIKQQIIFWSMTLITVFAITLLSLANVDRLIAVNFKPTVNDRIDYYYLSNLSFDAADGWNKIISDTEIQLPDYEQKTDLNSEDYYRLSCLDQSLTKLQTKQEYLNKKYAHEFSKNWREFNFSEYNAYQTIQSQPTTFNKLSNLLSRTKPLIDQYQKTNNYPLTPHCGSY